MNFRRRSLKYKFRGTFDFRWTIFQLFRTMYFFSQFLEEVCATWKRSSEVYELYRWEGIVTISLTAGLPRSSVKLSRFSKTPSVSVQVHKLSANCSRIGNVFVQESPTSKENSRTSCTSYFFYEISSRFYVASRAIFFLFPIFVMIKKPHY